MAYVASRPIKQVYAGPSFCVGGVFVFSSYYPHTDSKYLRAFEGFLSLPQAPTSKRKILWDNFFRPYDMVV